MRINQQLFKLFCLFVFLLSSYSGFSKIIYSANSSSWALTTTWLGGEIPTSADTVIIVGHEVTIIDIDSFAVARVEIKNSTLPFSNLITLNDSKLLVLGDVVMTADNFIGEINLQTKDQSVVNINGNLVVTRQTPSFNQKCQIYSAGTSKINVNGNFIYNYNAAADSETNEEILISGMSKLEVDGMTTFNMAGGKSFHVRTTSTGHLKLNGGLVANMASGEKAYIESNDLSYIEIGGNASLQNTAAGTQEYGLSLLTGFNGGKITIDQNLLLSTNKADGLVSIASIAGVPIIEVKGNITFDASHENTAHIYLDENANFKLGGNILRPNTDFGRIFMSNMATFEFNGTTPQTVPQRHLANAGLDSLNFTNQKFNNPSGFIMSEPIVIRDDLNLEKGVLKTDATNTLTIADGATITGGSDSSYVEGPIIKQGAVAGESFYFPLGHLGKYAPATIQPRVTSPTSQYTVQYMKCPPPYDLSLTAPLDQISGNQFWIVERTPTSEDFDLTLHWMDESAEGINDTTNMLIAGLNDTTVGSETWVSMGKFNVTSNGAVGSVTNDEKCPPPYDRTLFTLGSKAGNILPSELISFEAKKNGDQVYLDWVTSSEINSDHFLVEKSTDGINFERIDAVNAQGNSNTLQYYFSIDKNPIIGTNYYRLQRVDQNGMSSPTNTISIKIQEGSNPQVTIFPNPVDEVITIETVDFETDEMEIEVYFQNGQKVFEGNIAFGNRRFIASTNQLNINASGVYTILYRNAFEANSLKFIKM